MRITGRKKIEDCFDGSSVYGYLFDAPLCRADILAMKRFGELDYFPDFPRPFFRVRSPEGAFVKGVEGDAGCKVILPRKDREKAEKLFEGLFES